MVMKNVMRYAVACAVVAMTVLSAAAEDNSFTNDLAYLKSKWRADVTDESGFACRLLQDSVIL